MSEPTREQIIDAVTASVRPVMVRPMVVRYVAEASADAVLELLAAAQPPEPQRVPTRHELFDAMLPPPSNPDYLDTDEPDVLAARLAWHHAGRAHELIERALAGVEVVDEPLCPTCEAPRSTGCGCEPAQPEPACPENGEGSCWDRRCEASCRLLAVPPPAAPQPERPTRIRLTRPCRGWASGSEHVVLRWDQDDPVIVTERLWLGPREHFVFNGWWEPAAAPVEDSDDRFQAWARRYFTGRTPVPPPPEPALERNAATDPEDVCRCGHERGWHETGLGYCARIAERGDVCGCRDVVLPPAPDSVPAPEQQNDAATERLAELRRWAEDGASGAGHAFHGDCPWCHRGAHDTALELLDAPARPAPPPSATPSQQVSTLRERLAAFGDPEATYTQAKGADLHALAEDAIDVLDEVIASRPASPVVSDEELGRRSYPTQAVVEAWTWWVVPDDLIGGWAIATTNVPVSQQDKSRGGWVVANFVCKEAAEHIVAAHNKSVLR